MCGDVPISVWLSSQWLIEYTIGQDAQRRVHRLAEKLQHDLKELGFSPLHCMESLLSRQRKRQKRNAEDATDDLEGCQEWRVSMIGAFVFRYGLLDNLKFKRGKNRCGEKPDVGAQGDKVIKFLTALLSWRLVEEKCIGIVSSRGKCEMILEDLVVCTPEEPAAKSQRGSSGDGRTLSGTVA